MPDAERRRGLVDTSVVIVYTCNPDDFAHLAPLEVVPVRPRG